MLCVFDSTVMAPGGKLVVRYIVQIKIARQTNSGALRSVEKSNSVNGDARIKKRLSMVETRKVRTLSKCQMY